MKNFCISEQQIAQISCGLIADELSRNFNTYTDFLTQAAWSAETVVGGEALKLETEQITACAERVCRFFDREVDAFNPAQGDKIADWAAVLAPAILTSQRQFRFVAAVQSGAAETIHAADEIWQDARTVASLLHGRRRVVSMVSPHSLLGFVTTILAPNLQGLEVVDGRNMAPEVLAETLSFGDMLVATPTLWRYISQTLPKLANNVVGVSFGEPMTHELAGALRKMGLGAIRELYGSTETGLIGWRDAPTEAFVLFDHWQEENQQLIRCRPNGEARNVAPMDFLIWESDRTFKLSGRRDGAIQIGGVNVYPEKIAMIISDHPDIEICRIRVSQRGRGTDRLAVHIVLKEAVPPNEDTALSIDGWCKKNLRPSERPHIYNFEESLEPETEP